MSKVTIDLQYPFADGTKTLAMRRVKVFDQLAADEAGAGCSDAKKEVILFANLCEVSKEDIIGMDMIDYRKLQAVYSGFLSSAPAKSGKPA